jgi:hypothetical protein
VKFDIKVTAQHIKKGVRGAACHCPVALAVLQDTRVIDVRVIGETMILVVKPKGLTGRLRNCVIPLPADVTRRIDEFDYHGAMTPFEFSVEGKAR